MRTLREGMVPTFVWGVVAVVLVFVARAGWNAIYANWETNGQTFSAPARQPDSGISVTATLSHPQTNLVNFTPDYARRRKRELVTEKIPHYDWTLAPGQATEWTSLSEHDNRRKSWFVMVDGSVTQYLRYWDDTYDQQSLTPRNTALDEWITPAKDARWGRWQNAGERPVRVEMWLFE